MKPVFSLITFFLLLTLSANAFEIETYTATFDVVQGKVLVNLDIGLKKNFSIFEWRLPKDSIAIEVKDINFEIDDLRSYKKLKIEEQVFDRANIKYITSSMLEKTKDNFFILDLSEISAKKSITLKLPEKATLKYSLDSPQTSIIPKTGDVRTDGKRIIIHWDDKELSNANSLLVVYNEEKEINFLIITFIIIGLFLIIASVFYYNKKNKKVHGKITEKESLTKNLFEEEKKIVEILLNSKGNELWQKSLGIKSGLSKVRLSRKLRNLEQKGLIEKIPYGNTNKIRLKKA